MTGGDFCSRSFLSFEERLFYLRVLMLTTYKHVFGPAATAAVLCVEVYIRAGEQRGFECFVT